MRLTGREAQIVALLRRDPMIDAGAIAEAIGTSRGAVNVHLSNLGKKGVVLGRGYILGEQPGAVVIGGANMDVKARSERRATHGTSNPGHGAMAAGGVARNVAENLARLGTRTHLVAAIGRDAIGDGLLAVTSAAGVHVDHVHRSTQPTGTYTAILDADGELVLAVADMSATDALAPEELDRARDLMSGAGLVVVDGNLQPGTLAHALELARAASVRAVVEPVSVPKAERCAAVVTGGLPVHAVTPNREELEALTGLPVRTVRQVLAAARFLHDHGVQHVWVRLGGKGSVLSTAGEGHTRLPAFRAEVVDVTGAGDAMLAAFCHAVLDGMDLADAARFGHAAAALTVSSPHTVRPDLTARLVEEALALPPRSTR
jgi:pseudouridine kinase